MNDEVFQEISFPEGIAGEDKFNQKMSLVVFGETLCLIQHCRSYGEPPHCSIWMMKQYGVANSWVRQIRIDLSGGLLRKPIGMRKNGEVLLGTSEGYLVSYDPESKRIIYLGVQGTPDSYCWYSFDVDTYMESLVLLDKGADCCDEVIRDRFCAKRVKRTDRTKDLI
ncbi:unnamed protein product [Camellia sinensis]